MCNNYARLLDINVGGEPEDYLLWEAVDVRATFADPAKPPDVEHLCLAILVLETGYPVRDDPRVRAVGKRL